MLTMMFISGGLFVICLIWALKIKKDRATKYQSLSKGDDKMKDILTVIADEFSKQLRESLKDTYISIADALCMKDYHHRYFVTFWVSHPNMNSDMVYSSIKYADHEIYDGKMNLYTDDIADDIKKAIVDRIEKEKEYTRKLDKFDELDALSSSPHEPFTDDEMKWMKEEALSN